jgi:hypothetical protein
VTTQPPPSIKVPQWTISIIVMLMSVGGSVLTSNTVTTTRLDTVAQETAALSQRVDRLAASDADRAREQAVLSERLDSIQSLLVEVRSDVRQLARLAPTR